jgi:hypothetical protein
MAEIRRNVKNIFRTCAVWSVDVSKTKHDACTTKCHFVKNEDMLEWAIYSCMFLWVPQ